MSLQRFGFLITAVLSLSAILTGCIPYTVGSTAAPVPKGKTTTTLSTWVMPSIGDTAFNAGGPARGSAALMMDGEKRYGLSERADIGFRGSWLGFVVNTKQLLSGPSSIYDVSVMPGFGIVNFGQHAYFEGTLMASKRVKVQPPKLENGWTNQILPYFGLRVMQVTPIAEGAVHDRPTAGGFLGVRFGSTDFGISPEIGVFYDHSALGVRKNEIIAVPAISVHGNQLIKAIGDVIGMAGPMLGGGPRR
jgi:hypothetical protein